MRRRGQFDVSTVIQSYMEGGKGGGRREEGEGKEGGKEG